MSHQLALALADGLDLIVDRLDALEDAVAVAHRILALDQRPAEHSCEQPRHYPRLQLLRRQPPWQPQTLVADELLSHLVDVEEDLVVGNGDEAGRVDVHWAAAAHREHLFRDVGDLGACDSVTGHLRPTASLCICHLAAAVALRCPFLACDERLVLWFMEP